MSDKKNDVKFNRFVLLLHISEILKVRIFYCKDHMVLL